MKPDFIIDFNDITDMKCSKINGW